MADTEAQDAPLRTLIVDDEPLAVERIQVICAEVDSISVVGTASDGAAALLPTLVERDRKLDSVEAAEMRLGEALQELGNIRSRHDLPANCA